MDRNNECHEFLLFYLGHSMKSRSQSIRIKGFFNRRNLFNMKLKMQIFQFIDLARAKSEAHVNKLII